MRQLDLGAQPAGSAAFTWDGKTDTGAAVADGSYSFSLAATASGQSVTASPLMFSKVTGVIPGSGTQATQLQLGALGLVSLTDVRQID